VQILARALRGDDRAECRAFTGRCDRPGVAMREHVAFSRKQIDRSRADAPVDFTLFVVNAPRLIEQIRALAGK